MGYGPKYTVPYKRKKQNKTDYRKRLALLKSRMPRLAARKTNKRIIAQIITFAPEGDKTIIRVSSRDLKKYGLAVDANNTPIAYLTGYLLGKSAINKKIKKAVFDLGLNIATKGNKLYAVLKGAADAGIEIPHSEEVMPSAERLAGAHIKNFDTAMVEKIKNNIDSKVK